MGHAQGLVRTNWKSGRLSSLTYIALVSYKFPVCKFCEEKGICCTTYSVQYQLQLLSGLVDFLLLLVNAVELLKNRWLNFILLCSALPHLNLLSIPLGPSAALLLAQTVGTGGKGAGRHLLPLAWGPRQGLAGSISEP